MLFKRMVNTIAGQLVQMVIRRGLAVDIRAVDAVRSG